MGGAGQRAPPPSAPTAAKDADDASSKDGDAGEEQAAELWPSISSHRATLRTLRVLERHLRAQAPEMVLGARSDQHLIQKFGLSEDAKLLQDFRCSYHPKTGLGFVRGRLYLFTTHLAFAGGLFFDETTEVISLESIKEEVEQQRSFFAVKSLLVSAIKVETAERLHVFSNIWQPDKAIAAINEARHSLESTTQGHAEAAGLEGVGGEGGAETGNEVFSSTVRLVRCWPARAGPQAASSATSSGDGADAAADSPQADPPAESAAASAAAAASALPPRSPAPHGEGQVPPFLCCVRIDKLLLRGARRAGRHSTDGAALPKPLMITVHAPLVLENTLPVPIRWSICVPRDELLQNSGEKAGGWHRTPRRRTMRNSVPIIAAQRVAS